MLRLSAGTLLSLGLWLGRLRADNATSVRYLIFVATNDRHFTERDLRALVWSSMATARASAPSAELCLIFGDLTENGTPELTGIRNAFGKLAMRTIR
jgi:hypothetical protein